jgi:hypothetical protein
MHYHEKKISCIYLMLVVFPSNSFYRKPKHVATVSFNQQLLSTEIQGVFKKRLNFLNSAPTSKESTLWLLSTYSVRF